MDKFHEAWRHAGLLGPAISVVSRSATRAWQRAVCGAGVLCADSGGVARVVRR